MRMSGLALAAIAAVSAAVAGCATMEDGSASGLGSFNILSTQQEIALGKQVTAEVEKEAKLHPDAALQAYVQGIGARLARVSPRQDVAYSFKVIDAPDTVNAFALPGGSMYVYTGLMRLCENEAELAGVMAHEIAHVALQHHGKSLSRQYGYQVLTGIILGDNPNGAAQVVSGLLGQAVTSRFSRTEEVEADTLGMEILFRAGYNPDAMRSFFNKMLAEEKEGGGGNWLPIFASHPPTADRLANLDARFRQYPSDMVLSSGIYAERYEQQARGKL